MTPDPSPFSVIDVAGLAVRVEAPSLDDIRLVTRMIGDSPADRQHDVVVRIEQEEPPLPDRPPDFDGPYGTHWDDGHTHSFRHHWGFGAVVTGEEATLGGAAQGYERWVTVRNSMIFVLGRLLLERGRFVLHAAAFRRGDEAFVAIGDSGAGKSTLAFAAARAGWAVLADDMVVVTPEPDGMGVRGVPRVLTVPGEVADHLALAGERMQRDPRGRLELEDQHVDLGGGRLTGVIICGHSDGAGAVDATTTLDAMEALVPAFVLADLVGPLQRWFPSAIQMANGPVVRLRHARGLDERLEGAARLLDEAHALCAGTSGR